MTLHSTPVSDTYSPLQPRNNERDRMRRVRVFWRAALTLLLVMSLMWSGWSLWQFMRLPVAGWLMDRTEEQMVAAFDRIMARKATPEVLGEAIMARLNESPRNWVALEGLMALAEEHQIILSDDVYAAYKAARERDFGRLAQTRACGACAYDLRHCSLGPNLTCGLAVNLTVVGDVLSLSRETGGYLLGQEVDRVDVMLSFAGIGATGLALTTGGSSYVVKTGMGLLKTAHRMDLLSPELRGLYVGAFRDRGAEALRPALTVSQHLGTVHRHLGAQGTLHMVAYVDNAVEAQRMARMTTALGARSVGGLEVLGKTRFLRVALRWSDHVWGMISGILTALSAALVLFWSKLLYVMRRWLR